MSDLPLCEEEVIVSDHASIRREGANKTYCELCDNVHADTRKLNPKRWRCVKAPVKPGFGRVSFSYSPDPPYRQCEYVHPYGDDENCKMFEPIRKPKEEAA